MLLQQNNQKIVKSILFTGLLTLLASCGNSSALESMVRADPQLRDSNSESKVATATNKTVDRNDSLTNNPQENNSQVGNTIDKEDAIALNPVSSNRELLENDTTQPPSQENTSEVSVPVNFPPSFPIYPRVKLKEAKVGTDETSGMLTWTSSDNSMAIADYYQAELNANDWEIVKPFKFDSESAIARAIVIKDDKRVHLTLLQSKNSETGNDGTKLSAIYEPLEQNVAALNSETQFNEEETQTNTAITTEEDLGEETPLFPEVVRSKQNKIASQTTEDREYIPLSSQDFDDLDNVPEQLNQPLETVAALGILTPYTQNGNVELSTFAPNRIITRGEYARWLIAANNRYYEGDLGKKIYIANNNNQPAFQDIKQDHPDFGAIQGLAEAGLVPSRLTQDSTKLLFRPDAPLTREDLVTWKVPLDTRQALPKASIEAIEESWGFQDAASIDSSGIRALYADYQNGDLSNVRRVFGFTTLFQAKKPVTRAEAAASLWYFGFQGDGVKAREILESELEINSDTDLDTNTNTDTEVR